MVTVIFGSRLGDRLTGLRSRVYIFLLRLHGMKIGRRCRLEPIRVRYPETIELGDGNALTSGSWLWPGKPSNGTEPLIRIGRNNYFNRDVMIDACGRIEIGSNNMFGPAVYITDSNHVMDPARWVTETGMDVGHVTIGDGCWFGTRAVILKGVELGDRCVVAAGAVVTRSFPAGSVIGGVPAVLLRKT
jgi:acetyltransferase-like isoleucine patch superfamily enzyme